MDKPYIISVCSGKGGVGKSVIAANLGFALSMESISVLIWDADIHFPNQHLILGVEPPLRLSDVYSGNIPYKNAVFEIKENLHLLADTPAAGVEKIIKGNEILELSQQIKNDNLYDVIILDTSAGASYEVLQSCSISDTAGIMITDEPTSLLDAYGLIKILIQYIDIEKISLLVNNVIDLEDADDISSKLNLATNKFLNVKLDVLGYVPYDRIVRQSILQQEPFILQQPDSEVTKAIKKIASKIIRNNFKLQQIENKTKINSILV